MTKDEAIAILGEAISRRSFLNDDENVMDANEALSVIRAALADHKKAIEIGLQQEVEIDLLKAEVERLEKRLRDEFATSVNNAEEMREWKARAEKAEAALALHNGEGTENVGQPAPPAEPESYVVSRGKDDILGK